MDKTLISENSGSIYLRDGWQRGDVSVWDLVRGGAAYLQYKLGALDIQAWTVEMLRGFEGQRESEMIDEGRVLFERRMASKVYPDAVRLVAEHLSKGHLVAIVSGSVRFLVQPLADFLCVEHVLCTELETQGDVLTGRCIEPICFEDGKIYWLQGFIERHQVDLARSWFYTDSITDLPVLDLVGHPVATNPDPLLYRTANRRGWPIRIFESP